MLVLYHTLGCHLCELAEALLLEQGLHFEKKDIADDEKLMQQFAWTIPVVFNPRNKQQLPWPFDSQQLQHWLQA